MTRINSVDRLIFYWRIRNDPLNSTPVDRIYANVVDLTCSTLLQSWLIMSEEIRLSGRSQHTRIRLRTERCTSVKCHLSVRRDTGARNQGCMAGSVDLAAGRLNPGTVALPQTASAIVKETGA